MKEKVETKPGKKGWLRLAAAGVAVVALGLTWVLTGGGDNAKTQTLPVLTQAQTAAPDALTTYKQERAQTRKEDRAALEKLLARDDLDDASRLDAETLLTRLVRFTEEELALEGALAGASFAPCACVRAEGTVTVVTRRQTLTEGERALLLTLCQTHAGVEPAGVQVITAE